MINDLENVRLIRNNHENREVMMEGEINENDSKKTNSPYETVLSAVGFGKFHLFLYIVCALANASDAIEVLCVSFVLPTAQCDLNMSSSDKGFLSSMTFGGMLIGGYLWGTFSDIYGRKYTLFSALVFNAFFGVMCGLSQNLSFLLLFRFLSGIGVGGSVPIVWSYFSEFIPMKIRGRMICLLASSWLFGNLLVILMAYIILNHSDFSYVFLNGSFVLNNWRVFMITCSMPSFLTALLLLFLPESPKFYLYNGNSLKATRILKYIYKINHKCKSEDEIQKKRAAFELLDALHRTEIENKPNYSDDDNYNLNTGINASIVNPNQETGLKYMFSFFKTTTSEALKKTVELFKPPFLRDTSLVLFIFFCLCFGYYGLWMWLPELFKRMAATGGSPCQANPNINMNTTFNVTCRIEKSVYFDSFISAMSSLPGNIITVIFIDKIGRNRITCFSLLASGLSVFGIPFVRTKFEGLVLTTIFGGINVLTFNSFGCTSTELFPTRLRSTALGVQFIAARFGAILGNVIFGLAVDISCYIPLCTISLLLILSGILAFKLPESSLKDIK